MITQPGRNPRSYLLQRASPGKLHAVGVGAEPHVVMAVDEAGQHQPTLGVDHLRAAAHEIAGIGVRADLGNTAAADRHGLGPRD